MAKEFVIPSVFKAIDKMTKPIRKMGREIDRFAKRAEVRIARAERSFRKFGNTMRTVGRNAGMIGIAILAPMGMAVNAAVQFEDKMADVAKVTNTQLGSKEFEQLSDQVKDLSVFLAISTEEAAGLVEGLAQGGVAMKDLERVSMIAGKVGVAFGITGDEAGQAFIKIQNALGGTIASTERLMDSINFLGNTTASASSELVMFMAKGGAGVARATDASAESVAGFGSTLISMGKTAEESATIMRRFTQNMLQTDSIRKIYDSVGGGAEGMLKVIETGMQKSGQAQDKYFQQFGQYGLAIQMLGKNYETLTDTISKATNEQMTADSVLQEFENRSQTTAFKFKQAKAEFQAMVIEVGGALLPVLNDLIKAVVPIIKGMTSWMKANPQLVSTIAKVLASVGALSLAISGVAFILSGLSKVIYIAKGALWVYNAATKAVTIAQKLWNLAMMANPIGLIIGGVVALGAAVYGLSKAFSSNSRETELRNEIQREAAERTADQVAEINLLFEKLRKLNPESEAYTRVLKDLEKIQPGITEQYNLQKGAIDDLNMAQKELIKNIRKRAEAEVLAEKYKDAVSQRITEEMSGPGVGDYLIGSIIGGGAQISQGLDIKSARKEEEVLLKMFAETQMEDMEGVNPEDIRQEVQMENQNGIMSNVHKAIQEIKIKIETDGNSNATATDNKGNNIPVMSNTN